MIEKSYVVSKYKNGILACGFDKNCIADISFENTTGSAIGNIYVAKVTQIVSNINSVFILYNADKRGYLPLSEVINPILLNRQYDGKLMSGDELLVQLDTEAIRTKDPCFTTNLSIAGRYCVVSSGKKNKAVSSKICKANKELLLSKISDKNEFGIVVRTNAEELIETNSVNLLQEEIERLSGILNRIINTGIHRVVYSCIYEAPLAYLEALRDNHIVYDRIVTDDSLLYDNINSFIKDYIPEMLNKLSLYNNDNLSLSNLYNIEAKVKELLDSKVWLKSGAYLVIDETEAMYVIDVNSGKNNVKKSSEEYIYNINLEAAHEIMRQIRLRNLSGMILVDFINMNSKDLEDKLFSELSRLAKKDPVKTVIVDYTKLGLLEITRKKTKKSLKSQMNS